MSKITKSDFYCVYCGKKGIPVVRQGNSQREKGHLKKLFCLYCGKETNHVEIRHFGNYTVEDFYQEFNSKNFDAEGNRKMEYSQFRDWLNKEGVLYDENGEVNINGKVVPNDGMSR